ncbi:Flp pilus assembly protein TadD/cell division protein FtsN [Novosphingobium hassiacum]|uniref:Flp pilus assembly protein TadD/cell division protein FtsN n=1 Tax=Novosphingobium hassiacum TaxID=173676 RepID=A0A7W5ZV47_9SPHN|nr:SPOR domain-containing protein [Novosphingobium hassiacum]MBB3859663.1 Flp pilus assembly protein TadD/cell division protein FtsN [Novosphingobium hassiacum]
MKELLSTFAPSRAARLIVSTALAAGILTGCAAGSNRPAKLASSAQTALNGGSTKVAVDNAEKAVLADPRNAAYRVLLGNTYLKAGRFESARQAYDEAMELGEDSSRTALSLALADVALGRHAEAIDTLNSYRDSLEASDYGLALALAGQPAQGIAVLSQAVRGGENTVKVRQNLALAYAMGGYWREARAMAAQDVPAAELGNRMEQWAMMGQPELTRDRVAGLLSVPLRADKGQPAALALANFPGERQLSAQAAARAEPLAEAAVEELPATEATAAPQPSLSDASSQPKQDQLAMIDMPASSPQPMAAPYYQPAAKTTHAARAAAPTHKAVAPVAVGKGTHLVQLGSFGSAEGARRAWRHFAARNPALAGYRNVTTQVTVNGRQFWRVQAAGFNGLAAASSLCGSVKARGGACFVLRGSGPAGLPGQRPLETRMAKR